MAKSNEFRSYTPRALPIRRSASIVKRLIALSLLAQLVSASAVAHAQQSQVIQGKPTCRACLFTWTELGQINGVDGSGPMTHFALSRSHELLYFVDGSDQGVVKAARLRDGTLRPIGRRGGGPGEYEIVRNLMVDPDGRLLVLDGALSRLSTFDSAGAFVDSRPWVDAVGGVGLTAALVGGKYLALNLRPGGGPSRDRILVISSLQGGASTTVEKVSSRARVAPSFRRVLALAGDSTFLSIDPFTFAGTVYSVSNGAVTTSRRLTFNVPGPRLANAPARPSDGLFDTPYTPRIRAAWVAGDGLLWLYYSDAAKDWKPVSRPVRGSAPDRRHLQRLASRPRIVSTIDVVDLQTGSVLARSESPGSLGHAIGDGVFVREADDNLAEPRLLVSRIVMMRP